MNLKEKLEKISMFESMTKNEDTVNAFMESLDESNLMEFDSVEDLMKELEDEKD